MRLRHALVVLISLFLAVDARAQSSVASIEKSTDELIQLATTRLEGLAEKHHIPGMGLAIVTPQGTYTCGIGVMELGGAPAHADTLFEIGSTTKTFTGILTAILAQNGLLYFDDLVSEHVPYFTLKEPEANEEVTLRDLLSHRTGLTRTDVILGGKSLSTQEVIEQLGHAEPLAPFRTTFLYNNQMFLVAGTACESAGESDYATLMNEQVFQPLGMESSTALLEDVIDSERLSSGHKWLKVEEVNEHVPTYGIRLSMPAGSILSTPNDMALYLQFLIGKGVNKDGERILDESAFDELWTKQNAMGPTDGYGLGFMLGQWKGRRLVHHGGNIDGFTSQFALLPDQGIGFSLLMNVAFSAVQASSIDAIFSALLDEDWSQGTEAQAEDDIKAPYSPQELQAFSGSYELKQGEQTWTTLVQEGRLALDVPGEQVYVLSWPNEKGRWAFEAAPQVEIEFTKNDAGEIEALALHRPGVDVELPKMKEDLGLPSAMEILDLIETALPQEVMEQSSPMRILGRVHMIHQGLEGEYRMTYQDFAHWRLDMDFGKFGKITTVLNGDSGWSFSPLVGRKPLSETEIAESIRSAPFSSLASTKSLYKSFQVIRQKGEGETLVTELRANPIHGESSTYRVDAKGHIKTLTTGLSLGEIGAIPVTVHYDDYQTLSGMRIAHKIRSENPFTGVTQMTMKSLEVGIEVPESLWKDE